MSIQATALILATVLVAYPNASAERSLDVTSAAVPRWSTRLVSANPKLREGPAATAGADQALVEITQRGQCGEAEFSWAFSAAEATPPDFEPEDGELNRRDGSVRM